MRTDRDRATRRAYRKRMRAANPGRFETRHRGNRAAQRRRRLLRKYGLTATAFQSLWSQQGGCCPICTRALRPWHGTAIDHDHDTGAVRGLLCGLCNTGIGNLGDTVERLRAAVRYLESQPPLLALVS